LQLQKWRPGWHANTRGNFCDARHHLADRGGNVVLMLHIDLCL